MFSGAPGRGFEVVAFGLVVVLFRPRSRRFRLLLLRFFLRFVMVSAFSQSGGFDFTFNFLSVLVLIAMRRFLIVSVFSFAFSFGVGSSLVR